MDNLPDRIAENLVETLKTVTIANGHRVTLRQVLRPTTRPVTLGHLDAVVAIEGLSRDTAADSTLGIHWVLEWSVYVHVVTPEGGGSVESLKFEAASDVMGAIEHDVTRGGIARDTQVESVTPVADADTGMDGVLIAGNCVFVAGREDPYSQITP